jgi:hypothetical protein
MGRVRARLVWRVIDATRLVGRVVNATWLVGWVVDATSRVVRRVIRLLRRGGIFRNLGRWSVNWVVGDLGRRSMDWSLLAWGGCRRRRCVDLGSWVDWVVGNLRRNWVWDIASGSGLVFAAMGSSDSAGREGHQRVRVSHLG